MPSEETDVKMATELFQFQARYFCVLLREMVDKCVVRFWSLFSCMFISRLAIYIRYNLVHMLFSFAVFTFSVLFVQLTRLSFGYGSEFFVCKLHWTVSFFLLSLSLDQNVHRHLGQLLFMKIENICGIFPSFYKH